MLVSINPFKMLPIYSPATIEEYAKPSAYRLDPPHTFAIANSAFMKLTHDNVSQVRTHDTAAALLLSCLDA